MAQQQQELYSEPEYEGDETQVISGIVVDPEPFVSTQFYTFNRDSHQLMVQCILAKRYAHPEEIKLATPPSILSSWRTVWKDRHEDTAFQTGWKRIQDKLHAQVDEHGNELLYFKSNPQQFVPYINQWQEIVQGFHADADLKHLGLKDTIERIKQVWTVGAKFYGIPESYVRVCVSACPVCNSDGDPNGLQKRRRFEYTETMEVLARDVPMKLQQLAAKYKVILCIRQKYVRYKPFLAEVKDYCCHRAGEPNVKKSGRKKTNKFISNRCGCGFRIRAIVPITDYSFKDKSFSYQEEGSATFKIYPVHSGHDPGPQESAGMVINQLIDSNGMNEEVSGLLLEKEAEAEEEAHATAVRFVRELRVELASVEARIGQFHGDSLACLGQELEMLSLKLRSVAGFEASSSRYGVWEEGSMGTKEKEANQAEFGELESGFENLPGFQRRRPGKPPRKYARPGNKESLSFDNDEEDELEDEDSRPKDCEAVNEEGIEGMQVESFYPEGEAGLENDKWYGVSCEDDLLTPAGFRHTIA